MLASYTILIWSLIFSSEGQFQGNKENTVLHFYLSTFFQFQVELLFSQKHLWVFGHETKQYQAQSIPG